MHMHLHTTVLRVTNLEESRRWFVEKVGMTVVYEDIHYRLISLELGQGSRLSLWEFRPGEAPTDTTKETAYMVLLSKDARGDHATLTARGVKTDPIEEYERGLRMFWFSDPDNHRFCVIEFLPE